MDTASSTLPGPTKKIWAHLKRNTSTPQLARWKDKIHDTRECSSTFTLPKYRTDIDSSVGLRVYDNVDIQSKTPAVRTISANRHDDYVKPPQTVNHFAGLPYEVQLRIMSHLTLRNLVQSSSVSRHFHNLCFDGSLWSTIDSNDFYKDIPDIQLLWLIKNSGYFLRNLNLRGCIQIQSADFRTLSNTCISLECLVLVGCRALRADDIAQIISACRQLRKLDLGVLEAVNDSLCRRIARSCPLLEDINLGWCKSLSTYGFVYIAEQCRMLKSVYIMQCYQWDSLCSRAMMIALGRLQYLEVLVLDHCAVSNRDIKSLVKGSRGLPSLKSLKYLSLSNCTHLTHSALASLAGHVPMLQRLTLLNLSQIAEQGLMALLETTPNLVRLELGDCMQITDAVLHCICRNECRKTLSELDLGYCDQITDQGVVSILSHCLELAVLDVSNTHIGDYVAWKAAVFVKERADRTANLHEIESSSSVLVLNTCDCPNITWLGVSHILFMNVYIQARHYAIDRMPISYVSHPHPLSFVQLQSCFAWQNACIEQVRRLYNCDLGGAWQVAVDFGKLIAFRIGFPQAKSLQVGMSVDCIFNDISAAGQFSSSLADGNFTKDQLFSTRFFAALLDEHPSNLIQAPVVLRMIETDRATGHLWEFPDGDSNEDQGQRRLSRRHFRNTLCIIM